MKLTKPQRAALESLQAHHDKYSHLGTPAYMDTSFKAAAPYRYGMEITRGTMRALVRRGLAWRKPGDHLEVSFAITVEGIRVLAELREADNGTR